MYQDISQLVHDIKSNWKVVSDHYQYARSRFFYREDFIDLLLFNRSQIGLPRTSFVDYNAAFQYYNGQRKSLELQFQDQTRGLELPYYELVNFIDEPGATISVDGPLTEYQLPAEIEARTNDLFTAYQAEHPHITNGPTLRVADLQKQADGKYSVKLQRSHYFDEVRTTLSLDYPLDDDVLTTMRLEDLGDDNQLRPLNQSQMVNNIGVSTVLAFRSHGYWYFHMMPRHKRIGIFSGMLASVGGTVESPQADITDLVAHVTSEIKREIREETGLDMDELGRQQRSQVIPLAFLRELSRGGHPQFFYLTVMEEMSDKELKAAFKKAEWSMEFRGDMFSNIRGLDDVISPEFSSCLFYAMTYLQERRKLPAQPLILG